MPSITIISSMLYTVVVDALPLAAKLYLNKKKTCQGGNGIKVQILEVTSNATRRADFNAPSTAMALELRGPGSPARAASAGFLSSLPGGDGCLA